MKCTFGWILKVQEFRELLAGGLGHALPNSS